MRWMTAGLCLITMTGCPETHRRGGQLDRAMRKDLRQKLQPSQQEGCSEEVWNQLCDDDRDESEECIKACGK